MIDLIIPVYNNRDGLMRSLMSIGTEINDLYITIVDDASNCTYDDIIEKFTCVYNIQYYRLDTNSGPGIARQYALVRTNQPYVAFLDTGDVFCAPNFLQHQMNIAMEMPDCVFFTWAHNELFADGGSQYIPNVHNRLHGKLYKRSFLQQYNIHFNPECPRINEDIGFNVACRLIAGYLSDLTGKEYIYENEESAVNWSAKGPSIVRANNCEYYYHQQNYGYARNATFAVQLAEEAKVPVEYIARDSYGGMAFLYCSYLSTQNRHPEYAENAFAGAVYYYEHVFSRYADYDLAGVQYAFYRTLANYLADESDAICDKLVIIDYAQFLNQCEQASKEQNIDYSKIQCMPTAYYDQPAT